MILSQSLLDQVRTLANEAGKHLARFYQQDVKIQTKSDNTPVTEADLFVSQFLIEKLTALCREREGITTGQILEYFRDTEFSKPLEILASWDHLLDDLEIINAFSQNYRRLNII